MKVEISLQRGDSRLEFSTEQSVEEIQTIINDAIANGTIATFVDDKERTIVVPGNAIGYAIIGSQPEHRVGFGSL